MNLPLDPERARAFEDRMSELAPWMHAFKFGEEIYTGFYKYEGLGAQLTYVNRRSAAADVARMREAYSRRDPRAWPDFVERVFQIVAPDRAARANLRFLDVASATGQLSMRAVDFGFGRVVSSEIRENQIAQQQLILESIADPRYRHAITVVHDPVSADSDAFPERYRSFAPDVVASFGLLYHLENPAQHLRNLWSTTNRFALVYTMTHQVPFAKRAWYLTIEDREWITKATSGVSWTPHFLEVARVAREAGFRKITIAYPEMFQRNFRSFDRYTRATDLRLFIERLADRLLKVKLGTVRNQQFEYFRFSNINPNYFCYVLEK